MSILLSEHFIGESFDFNYFEEIFKQMGIVKRESQLTNRTLRIFLRLKNHLDQQSIDYEKNLKEIFKSSMYSKIVRS